MESDSSTDYSGHIIVRFTKDLNTHIKKKLIHFLTKDHASFFSKGYYQD